MSNDAAVVPVTLFCPHCSHETSGSPEELAAPRMCGGCGAEVSLIDYSREPIGALPEPKQPSRANWADHLFRGFAILCGLLTVLAAASLWSGTATGVMWLGLSALAAAAPLALRFAHLQREALRQEDLLKRMQRALTVTRAKLQSAAEINQGFQRNIAKVAAEEKRRLQEVFNLKLRVIDEKAEDAQWRMRRADDQYQVVRALGDRLINEAFERISIDVTPRNFEASRRRLREVIEFCRENDYRLAPRREEEMTAQLVHRYNTELRLEQERQRREAVSARLQAEQRVYDQMGYEITRAESHRSEIRKRLNEAQAAGETAESSSATLKRLKTELQEAEIRARKATDMARHPKAGHVMVLSNVGSLDDGIVKIYLSRHIDPLEDVEQLAREALPFPFDVHMYISSEDAVGLVHKLYEELHEHRVNRIDLSKDYFRTNVETVWRLVTTLHGTVECRLAAPAEEFHESQLMSPERFRHISQMMKAREDWASDLSDA